VARQARGRIPAPLGHAQPAQDVPRPAVALQDVAAAEAERSVRELGFNGVLVNGYSDGAP
jgi:hypothetical protein